MNATYTEKQRRQKPEPTRIRQWTTFMSLLNQGAANWLWPDSDKDWRLIQYYIEHPSLLHRDVHAMLCTRRVWEITGFGERSMGFIHLAKMSTRPPEISVNIEMTEADWEAWGTLHGKSMFVELLPINRNMERKRDPEIGLQTEDDESFFDYLENLGYRGCTPLELATSCLHLWPLVEPMLKEQETVTVVGYSNDVFDSTYAKLVYTRGQFAPVLSITNEPMQAPFWCAAKYIL